MRARNIYWRHTRRREDRLAEQVKAARGETRAAITCPHTRLGKCFLRIRPGDTRKSCWAQCLSCGTYVACNC